MMYSMKELPNLLMLNDFFANIVKQLNHITINNAKSKEIKSDKKYRAERYHHQSKICVKKEILHEQN